MTQHSVVVLINIVLNVLGIHIIYTMPVKTFCPDGIMKDTENIIFCNPCIKTQIFLGDPRNITRFFTILRNVV
jgi:hypothetical protein